MPFHYSGVLRKSQWKAFRDWTLNERRAVASRVRYLNSELNRIGRVTVVYEPITESTLDPVSGAEIQVQRVSEKRRGFIVTSGSSLEKIIQSYIAVGGNPASVSLYLQPDQLQFTTDLNPIEDPNFNPNQMTVDSGFPGTPFDQPYGGVIAPKSTDSYGIGGQYQGGLPTFVRDPYSKIGRFVDLSDASAKIQIKTDFARQGIKELDNIEARIIKLCDLREQLLKERDELIQQAIGGTVPDYPEVPDTQRFALNLHLTRIVEEMDRVFYTETENGEPDFDSIKLGTAQNPQGISNYDTLFDDNPDEDTYATG